jgi:hypothetical protein
MKIHAKIISLSKQSEWIYVYLSIQLLFVSLFIHPSNLSIYLSINQSISIHPSAYRSVHLLMLYPFAVSTFYQLLLLCILLWLRMWKYNAYIPSLTINLYLLTISTFGKHVSILWNNHLVYILSEAYFTTYNKLYLSLKVLTGTCLVI